MKGFTLTEVVIAIGVLAIAILTTVFSIINLQDLNELSREKVAAVTDAVRVLEAMRDQANLSPANLQSTNWTTWANTNVIAAKGGNEVHLNQENVTAAFPAGTANPVTLTLTVHWQHKQRSYSYPVVTQMTDRSG